MCLPEDYPCRGAPGAGGRAAGDPKAMDIPPTALLLGPHWVELRGNTALWDGVVCSWKTDLGSLDWVLGMLTHPGCVPCWWSRDAITS